MGEGGTLSVPLRLHAPEGYVVVVVSKGHHTLAFFFGHWEEVFKDASHLHT